MLIILLAAVIGYCAYRYWNHARPADSNSRPQRAGILAVALGAVTLPWLWWSALPEAAILAGVATIILAKRRQTTNLAHLTGQR